ncbi:MAG: phosphotransferase family protein [Dermatophilaceae bacterium]
MTAGPSQHWPGVRAWATAWAGELGATGAPAPSTTTSSGAELVTVGDVVVKVHRASTDGEVLRTRLTAAASPGMPPVWVAPLVPEPRATPDGRWASAWPRVEVLDPSSATVPWAAAGALLARWHAIDPPAHGTPMPAHGGPARLGRAVARARLADHRVRPMLVELGERLVRDVERAAHGFAGSADDVTGAVQRKGAHVIRPHLVHGDWHLGQLGRAGGVWRLLDVDDLGVGDPAWDLGRPAGFWAAGLLDDLSWHAFFDGYRDAAGPAVPPTGDPWPRLDLAARCAVYVATVRELVRGRAGPRHVRARSSVARSSGAGSSGAGSSGAGSPGGEELRSLLTACARW